MSPRTGRPPKGETARHHKLNLRLSESEQQKIQTCADRLGMTRTDAIVYAMDRLLAELDKK